jgi:hypothetical protein
MYRANSSSSSPLLLFLIPFYLIFLRIDLNNFPRERFPDSSGGFSFFLEIFEDFLFSENKIVKEKTKL